MSRPVMESLFRQPQALSADAGRLGVGTAGYSYTEWAEAGFYPPETKPGQMLSLYARRFSFTELNSTWYQMPRAEAVERLVRQVPPGFMFSAKLTRGLTHEIEPDRWADQAEAYRQGLAPLIQTGRLAAVLARFPRSFERSVTHRRYLGALLDELAGLPVAVEFGHESWAVDRVLSELTRRRVALAAVDGPDLAGFFPALDAVTSPDFFYIRFYGRNAKGWRTGNKQAQSDYSYREEELRAWIETKILKMAAQARTGLIVFNNYARAQAPQNAFRLMELLHEYGLVCGQEQ